LILSLLLSVNSVISVAEKDLSFSASRHDLQD